MIQQITINVEVPAGYEAIRYGMPVKYVDYFLTLAGNAMLCQNDHHTTENRIILRKLWAFPAWFAAGWWLYKCVHGQGWFASDFEPYIGRPNRRTFNAKTLWDFHGETFTPPTVDKLQCVR